MIASHRRVRLASLVLASVAGLSVAAACNGEVEVVPAAVTQCPHTWNYRKLTSKDPPQLITSSLAGRITSVPEYHDCQRLVAKDGAYGPLVVAFARDGLDDLGRKLTELASSPTSAKALAAAEIWNVDTLAYLPLKIDTGFSCLYVERAGESWRAKLLYYGNTKPDCTTAIDLNAADGLALSVRPRSTTSDDFRPTDFPPVVRWEWDGARSEHYLGFKCDDTIWCEAGLDGFTSAPPVLTTDPAWPREVRRTLEIRGWLDEQVLARAPTQPGSVLTPASVRGTIVPRPDLRSRTFNHFRGNWVPVAHVLLNGHDTEYATKLNFVPPTDAAALPSEANSTTVYICWAGTGTCDGAPADTCAVTPGAFGAGKWLAKYTAPGRDPIYACTFYRPHPLATKDVAEHYTLGTARWRWLPNDETGWIGCPHGCCETGTGFG